MAKGSMAPILVAVLGNLMITAIAAFLISFFPLLYRSIDVASNSADSFGNAIIQNAYDQVARAAATNARGFEGVDSAGIQDLYRAGTPVVSKYWLLRARLAGDLTIWLTFVDGSGIFVGRTVPVDESVARTPNASTVWVTELHNDSTYHTELWHMEGINTSLIRDTRIGPFPSNFNVTATPWYQDYINSIYAHWRDPEVDTFQQYTAIRIGAQGGLNNSARYCVYQSEINSHAFTDLLSAIPTSASGQLLVYHVGSGAVLGANFPFNSLVNESGELRPRRYLELSDEAPFFMSIVRQFQPAIEACTTSCTLDVGVSFDKIFIRVRNIQDEYGLKLRIIIVLQAIDFLMEIQTARENSLSITLPSLTGVVLILSIVTWLTMKQASEFLRAGKVTPPETIAGGLGGSANQSVSNHTDSPSAKAVP